MKRFFNIGLAGAALVAGLALVPNSGQAQNRQDQKAAATYHDKKNNDDHQWNDREDQAYKIYQRDNHKKDVEFGKLKERDPAGLLKLAAQAFRRGTEDRYSVILGNAN